MPVTDAEMAAAHRQAVETSIKEVAEFLQEVLGQKLTAIIANVDDPKTVGRWARGVVSPRSDAEERLRAAYQVFQLLQMRNSEGVVRAWFIGMNPSLELQAPAKALSEARFIEVMSAARAFAESVGTNALPEGQPLAALG